jgi:PRD1 phage membrane DNA delivery
MGDEIIKSIFTVAIAITGVAIIAVLVSKNANTSQVIQASGSAYSNALSTALSPVTGTGGFGGFSGGAGLATLSQ